MKITKTYCDLCNVEIDKSSAQSVYEYWLPLKKDKKTGEVTMEPQRFSLCIDCAKAIQNGCLSIMSEYKR